MSKVLGAVRQSKTKDKSISPEVQQQAIVKWSADNGIPGEDVLFSFDLSTSGGKSPFDREGLGRYLNEPHLAAQWDILAVTRLDRLARSCFDYLRLAMWCDEHKKRLVILDDPTLDTGSPSGKAMATMRAVFAEMELNLIRARRKESYEYQRAVGKWTGGRLNYGWAYNPETRELEPDVGGTADVLNTMADMAIEGKSHGQIVKWLNSTGHLTVIGRQWRTDTVRRVLRHESTRELLGEFKAAQLRSALKKREQIRGERTNGHLLLRVAYCGTCRSPLYAKKQPRPSGGTYICLKCGWATRMDHLEATVESELLTRAGHMGLTKRELVPGDDHSTAIRRLEADIDALERISGTEAVVMVKRAEIEHLRVLQDEPDRYMVVPAGMTVAERWETLSDAADKGSFLRTYGVKATVSKVSPRKTDVTVDLGDLTPHPGSFENASDVTVTAILPVRVLTAAEQASAAP